MKINIKRKKELTILNTGINAFVIIVPDLDAITLIMLLLFVFV
jgi:hypothetical protein